MYCSIIGETRAISSAVAADSIGAGMGCWIVMARDASKILRRNHSASGQSQRVFQVSFLSLSLAGRVGVATADAFLVAPRPPLRSAGPPRKGEGPRDFTALSGWREQQVSHAEPSFDLP